MASAEEVYEESRWAVRGGWTTYVESLMGDWGATFNAPQGYLGLGTVQINLPLGLSPKVVYFQHLFSGLRRERDLGWFLQRVGGSRGLKVVVSDYEVAYGEDFDLGRGEVRARLLTDIREGRCDGAFSEAPCSTWSRARFAPGGPPPLRTRDPPWGRPGLCRRDQAKVEEHSSLILFGLQALKEVSQAGGVGAAEHPRDPGVRPFPSIFATSEFQSFEVRAHYEQVNFCQCAFGGISRKPTTLACSAGLRCREWFADRVCVHASRDPLIAWGGEEGGFRTRQAQTDPTTCAYSWL